MRKGDTCWQSGRRRPERGDSLPGDGPGLGVGVVDALLDGLGQDGHVSGIVGEHGEDGSHFVPGVLERNTRQSLAAQSASSSRSSLLQPDPSGSLLAVGSWHGFLKTLPWVAMVTEMGEHQSREAPDGGIINLTGLISRAGSIQHSTLKCCWKT